MAVPKQRSGLGFLMNAMRVLEMYPGCASMFSMICEELDLDSSSATTLRGSEQRRRQTTVRWMLRPAATSWRALITEWAVSYTHPTLPTILLV